MSSPFDIKDQVRRLREAVAYLRRATLATVDELTIATATSADDAVPEEWRAYLAELQEYVAFAEALSPASGRPPRRRRKLLVDDGARKRAAASPLVVATLH